MRSRDHLNEHKPPKSSNIFFTSAVLLVMTKEDQNTIIAIWNDMVLRKRLDNDPYGLSQEELTALAANDELQDMIEFVATEVYLEQYIKL